MPLFCIKTPILFLKMKKSSLILLSLLFVVLSAAAQRAKFEITFKSSVPAEVSNVYVRKL